MGRWRVLLRLPLEPLRLTDTYSKVLSAVRQDFGVSAQSNAHCELSAVRQVLP